MSIYTRGEPVANQQFRDNTGRAGKMLGVMKIPAKERCHCCGKMRTAKTGKYVEATGFVCGMCYRPRRVS